MDKRKCTVILLLVFAIIEVHSSIQSIDAINDLFEDADQNNLLLQAAPVASEGLRSKRTPGGPSNSDATLEKIKNTIRRFNMGPRVTQPENPAQRDRREAMEQLNGIIDGLMQREHLTWDNAVARAYDINPGLIARIREL